MSTPPPPESPSDGLPTASTGELLASTDVGGGLETPRKINWRVAIAITLGGMLWIAPYIGTLSVLLPSLVARVAPDDKVQIVAVLTISGAVLSLVTNIILGALSDATRTRIGPRAPWIIGGAAVGAVALYLLSTATAVSMLILWWCVYMVGLNAIIAPMVAVISDDVPAKHRGTVSAMYGVGMLIGATGAVIVAAQFVADPSAGLRIFAVCTALSAVVFVAFRPLTSNVNADRVKVSFKELARTFRPPTTGARDFYFALSGKFALVAGTYAITNYQFYILTDYIKLGESEISTIIAIGGGITLVTGLVFGLVSGSLSDRLGRRKPFVIGAAVLVAIGTMFPLIAPFGWAMLVAATFSGIGNGAYQAVDQALNVDVLPNPESAAKDLGILNVANSGGQILGPVVMSTLVTITGGYQAGFVAAGLLVIISAFLIMLIRSVR